MLKIFLIILVVWFYCTEDVCAQQTISKSFSGSSETIKELYKVESKDAYSFPVGYNNKNAIFFQEDRANQQISLLTLEETGNFLQQNEYNIFNKENVFFFSAKDSLLFFARPFFESMEDDGYHNLYLSDGQQEYFLDSIYNADKLIHASFSSDGRYLLVNTMNTLDGYYNPEQDNITRVYDLSKLDQGKITTAHFPCQHCSDSYLVNNQLFFTVGRKDNYDGYGFKDIYVAPWGNLQDSIKIASLTDLRAVSADGKYVLGQRFYDRQHPTDVVIEVVSKRYQMLLGREYSEHRLFYSYHAKKFAYDFDTHLIYVDYPQTYPFDALKWRNEEIPYRTHETFWQQYEHSPLD